MAQAQTTEHTSVDTPQQHFPPESLYRLLAAELALSRHMPLEALVNYVAVALETQDPKVAARATEIAVHYATVEDALVPAKIWAKHDKDNIEAQITTAALLIRANKISQVSKYFLQIEKINPQLAYQDFIILHQQLSDPIEKQRVIDVLEQMASKDNSYNANVSLSSLYLSLNQGKKALDKSTAAISSLSSSLPLPVILVHTQGLLMVKGAEQSQTFLMNTLNENPENTNVRLFLTQFLLDHRQEEKAKAQVEILSEQHNIPGNDLLKLARLTMNYQWFDLSEKFLLKAQKIDSQQALSNYFLGRIFEIQKQYTKSVHWYTQVNDGPFHIVALIRASGLMSELKNYDKALDLLNQANPTTFEDEKQIILAQVDIFNQTQQSSKAVELLTGALSMTPDDIDLLYTRALTYDVLDNLPLAQKDLKLILKQDPNNVDALNALGYILSHYPAHHQDALNYLSQALEIAPNNASIMDSMGWLQYKMGNLENALNWLEKAFKLNPDPEIAAHLGEVLWHNEKITQAQKIWKDALASSPDHQPLLETVKRFLPNKPLNTQTTPAR